MAIYRILDANLNRSREGLRVCEEVARFVLCDKKMTRQLKICRHAVSDMGKRLFDQHPGILKSRNVWGDVGRETSALENSRIDFKSLFEANSQRAKESLRALEETVKLLQSKDANRFKKVRFRVYAIEKKALSKLETLRHHLPRISRGSVAKRTGARSNFRRR